MLSAGKNLFAFQNSKGEKFKMSEAGLGSVYVREGIKMEATLSFLSEKGWDCLYNVRFKVNPEARTCGLEQLNLNHCAQ